MKDRTKPLPDHNPNSNRYFDVELNGKTIGLRIPFPLHTAKILKALDEKKLASFGDGNTKANLSRIDEAADLWVVMGAAVGLAWYDKDRELEADFAAHGKDIESYGEAVLEELYDEGFEMSDFGTVFPELAKKMTLSMLPREVQDRADFS